jgi:hypothetical protein
MEAIAKAELRDESIFPDDLVLKDLLGESFDVYQELLQLFDANQMEYGWRYYHDGNLWLNKVQKKKRTIVWMSGWKGYLQATIYFPAKYIEDIYKLDIPESRKNAIKETKNSGTSKPCVFQLRRGEHLEDFNKVMQFKLIAR